MSDEQQRPDDEVETPETASPVPAPEETVVDDVTADVAKAGDVAPEAAAGGAAGDAPDAGAPGAEAEAGPEPAPRLAPEELKAIVEALVFAAPEPVTVKALQKVLSEEPVEAIEAAVAELSADYTGRGLQVAQVAGGYQITTRPELHEWVRRLFHERTTQKLSVQALETLAVIAYRQPVTAAEITEIRGVNASGVLSTLLERHLVKIVGRRNVVGRPFLYGTTKEFLIRFGLKDVADLPKIEDMIAALGFEPPALLVEKPVPDEMLPLDADDVDPEDRPAPPGDGGTPGSSA
jgi:segregation and condensation protein B